jgi:hypothetical protein
MPRGRTIISQYVKQFDTLLYYYSALLQSFYVCDTLFLTILSVLSKYCECIRLNSYSPVAALLHK